MKIQQASAVAPTSSTSLSSTVPSYYQPYSMMVRSRPPLIPNFQQGAAPPSIHEEGSHSYASFVPPVPSTHLGRNMIASVISPTTTPPPPPVAPVTMVPTTNTLAIMTKNNHHSINNNKSEPHIINSNESSAVVHLQQLTNLQGAIHNLTDRVRQWESWYMATRPEMEQTQTRISQLESQVNELKRQKAVLSARVHRWQSWAKAVKVTEHKPSKAKQEEQQQQHQQQQQEVARSSKATTMPYLDNKPPATGLPTFRPRPLKKRPLHADKDDPSDSRRATKAVKQSPRPIIKMHTACQTRSSTPDILAAVPTPITPSEEETSRQSVAV